MLHQVDRKIQNSKRILDPDLKIVYYLLTDGTRSTATSVGTAARCPSVPPRRGPDTSGIELKTNQRQGFHNHGEGLY